MDGVLTDLEKQFKTLGEGSWDTVQSKYGSEYLWNLIENAGVKFWSEMPWMRGGEELWNTIKRFIPTILTSPGSSVHARSGKVKWVQENLGNVDVILERYKEKYATPQTILIDDRLLVLQPFEKAGGIAIHHTDVETTLQELMDYLS